MEFLAGLFNGTIGKLLEGLLKAGTDTFKANEAAMRALEEGGHAINQAGLSMEKAGDALYITAWIVSIGAIVGAVFLFILMWSALAEREVVSRTMNYIHERRNGNGNH